MKIRAVALALVLAAAAAPALAQTAYGPADAPEPGASQCPGGLCGRAGLDGFFRRLDALKAGGNAPNVHIVQIGDSLTAGDQITGKLRAGLQARFGVAGRGAVPAGVPYGGYAPYQMQASAEGWATEVAALRGPYATPTAAFGLGAVRGQGTPGSALTLTFEPGAEARRLGVCGWASGDGNGLRIEGAGEPEDLNLNTFDDHVATCVQIDLQQPAGRLRLVGEGAGVVLDTVWTETGRPGVIVSNLGLVGSTLRDLAGRDDAMMLNELGNWDPALVILAYGVNEGFEDGLDPVAYEALLRTQIERLRFDAPGASLLILGAPDAQRSGAVGGCSADGMRAPPPSLAVVRDVQKRVAADMGVAFWDWHGRMGGDCSADRLATRAEPFMRGDRVHFTAAGADWVGGILLDDLMAAYTAWQAEQGAAD